MEFPNIWCGKYQNGYICYDIWYRVGFEELRDSDITFRLIGIRQESVPEPAYGYTLEDGDKELRGVSRQNINVVGDQPDGRLRLTTAMPQQLTMLPRV